MEVWIETYIGQLLLDALEPCFWWTGEAKGVDWMIVVTAMSYAISLSLET